MLKDNRSPVHRVLIAAAVFVAATAGLASGQAAAPKPLAPNVEEHKLSSKLMDRQMPYRVILPGGYGDAKAAQARYGVIYLLHGLTGHFNNWTDSSKAAQYALDHKFIIVTPEGNNGWYTDSISTPTDKFESYIVQELIPEIDKKYRTAADREHRVIAGLSMGGYGSLKFGLKYPAMFSLVGSFSGALGAATYPIAAGTAGNAFQGVVASSLSSVFGPADSETRKANDIFALVRSLTPEKIKTMPFMYVSCGTEDFVFSNSREFGSLLLEKKVPHEYRHHPGMHDWVFWDDQIREFLAVAERRMKK